MRQGDGVDNYLTLCWAWFVTQPTRSFLASLHELKAELLKLRPALALSLRRVLSPRRMTGSIFQSRLKKI